MFLIENLEARFTRFLVNHLVTGLIYYFDLLVQLQLHIKLGDFSKVLSRGESF